MNCNPIIPGQPCQLLILESWVTMQASSDEIIQLITLSLI